jgi:hypothetical protein
VRAAFPAAKVAPSYDVGVMTLEGEASLNDGERRLSITATAREEVPTVERWIAPEDCDVDVYAHGVWHADTGRRCYTITHATKCVVATADLAKLRALPLRVAETQLDAIAA